MLATKEKKIPFDLSGVPRTLLLPLFGRAAMSHSNPERFYDEKAEQIMAALDYDFKKLTYDAELSANFHWAGERALYFDNEIKRFTATYPNATIVNIGAGLETSFYRVDNGELNWVDLDVPEVIALRQQLLPQPPRVHYVDKSLLDYSWLDDVAHIGQPIFLFAGGVFMYFKEQEVRDTLLAIAEKLPGAQLVFDIFDAKDLEHANSVLSKYDMPNTQFKWGFNEAAFKTWSDKFKYIKHDYYKSVNEIKSAHKFSNSYMVKVDFV